MARDAVDDLRDLDEATVDAIRAAVDHQERRELQRLAKLRGIKANQKTALLVEELARRLAAYDAGARSATPPPPATPVATPAPVRRRNTRQAARAARPPPVEVPGATCRSPGRDLLTCRPVGAGSRVGYSARNSAQLPEVVCISA